MTQLKAVIFDMDGILIDSEPFWFQAEKEVFATVGFEMTDQRYGETMGRRVGELVAYWMERHPWTGRSVAEVADAIGTRVIELVHERGEMLPGVNEAISLFKSKSFSVGLATSSDDALIDVVIDSLHLQGKFDDTYSAQHEKLGKPDPGVYLRAADRLGVDPSACVAIEDSINGIKAAKAAGCYCIAVPEAANLAKDPARFDIADVVVESLLDIDDALLSRLG